MLKKILKEFYLNNTNTLNLEYVLNFYNTTLDDLKKGDVFKKALEVKKNNLKLKKGYDVGRVSKGYKNIYLNFSDGSDLIDNRGLKFALQDDLVLYDEFAGKIVTFVERNQEYLIAEVKVRKRPKKRYYLDADKIEHKIVLLNEVPKIEGLIVYLKIEKTTRKELHVTYLKTIGHKNDPDTQILKVLYKNEWPDSFSEEALEEARSVKIDYDKELKERKDYRKLLTFTIDGKDAKDFDDAISIRKIDEGFELGVHIADISYLVKPGTKLDKEALERGTSLYLGNKVVPMLPHEISDLEGSLMEGKDRLCLSVMIKLSNDYERLDYKIEKSVINSDYRLTYEQVNNLFEREIPIDINNLDPYLLILKDISDKFHLERKEKGSIDFDSTELEFVFDKDDKVVDVKKRKMGPGERLIEALMIEANETVARYLTDLDYPMVYRIHEKPDPVKIRESVKIISKLGFKPDTKEFMNPKSIQRLISKAENTRFRYIVSSKLVQSMMKAKYSPTKDIHYGLNSTCYTHFTAPIRRYPDLLVHRIIHSLILSPKNFNKDFNYYSGMLPETLEYLSKQERVALSIERDLEKLYSIRYFQNVDKDELFKGQIVSLKEHGMFIELQNGIQGFAALRELPTYFDFNENELLYRNSFGKTYRLGDYALVKFLDYNLDRLDLDFKIIRKV